MSDEGSTRTVRVRVRLPDGASIPRDSKLHVRIEDISAADRAARVLGHAEFAVRCARERDWVEVEIPAGLVERGGSYSAVAQISRKAGQGIEAGDFFSPAVHPVLAQGAPDEADIDLVEVR